MKRRGIALLTVVLLSLIALIFSEALIYMTMKTTEISGTGKRYSSALEAAKGASDLIIQQILNGSLKCENPPCKSNSLIDLGGYSTMGDYQITAKILSEINKPAKTIYAIEVEAKSVKTPEKAVIDFVYEVY